jgi:hypothetical protein
MNQAAIGHRVFEQIDHPVVLNRQYPCDARKPEKRAARHPLYASNTVSRLRGECSIIVNRAVHSA